MKTLTLKQRTSYVLPQRDRSAVAATAITLRKPLDREAQLRAELAAAKAALATAQEEVLAAKAETKALKDKAEQDGLRRTRLEDATRAAGGRVFEPRETVPMLTLAGRTTLAAQIGARKPTLLQRLAFWR